MLTWRYLLAIQTNKKTNNFAFHYLGNMRQASLLVSLLNLSIFFIYKFCSKVTIQFFFMKGWSSLSLSLSLSLYIYIYIYFVCVWKIISSPPSHQSKDILTPVEADAEFLLININNNFIFQQIITNKWLLILPSSSSSFIYLFNANHWTV